MDHQNQFVKWLEEDNKSKPTIKKYVRNIGRISEELGVYYKKQINLYQISNPIDIENIREDYLSIDMFKEKDLKYHREYSSALSKYKQFLEEYKNHLSYRAEFLLEEEEYQKNILHNLKVGIPIIDNVMDIPVEKPEYGIINNRKIWKRNSNLASKAVIDANFFCEFNINDQHFISKSNKKNYVEAHHFVPMKFQDEFETSLDVSANLISLCVICHRKLHLGNFKDKKEILDKLYFERRERLENCGIDLSLDKLYIFYK